MSTTQQTDKKKKRKRISPILITPRAGTDIPCDNTNNNCSTSRATISGREPITLQLSSSASVAANAHHEVLHSTVTPAFATGDKTAIITSDHATMKSVTNKSGISVTLSERTRPTAVSKSIHTHADLQRLFHSHVEISIQNQNRYVRDPSADWIQDLQAELSPQNVLTLQSFHKNLETTHYQEVDVLGKWNVRSEFATKVIQLWLLEQGRTLADVICKAKLWKQDQFGYSGGIKIEGDYVREYLTDATSKKFGGTLKELIPIVSQMSSVTRPSEREATNRRDDKPVKLASVYRVEPSNHFNISPNDTATIQELSHLNSNFKRMGSLNTTHDFNSAVVQQPPFVLEKFHTSMMEVTDGYKSHIELNPNIYLIYKGEGYMTPYHSDVHTTPQITLYHQLSGTSIFHFLPLLVGLYVTEIGRSQEGGPQKAKDVLVELDQRGIGTVGVLNAGEVMMIMPYGSHGVFVPCVSSDINSSNNHNNSGATDAKLSTIRAAEFFITPILHKYHNLLSTNTNTDWIDNLMKLPDSDRAHLLTFEQHQLSLMNQLRIDKKEWFFLARRMLQNWESDLQHTNTEDDDEEKEELNNTLSQPL